MLNNVKQQLMLPQFTFGLIETAFNALLKRSPHIEPNLRKLSGKVLKIALTSPKIDFLCCLAKAEPIGLATTRGSRLYGATGI